jgi:predicted ferric reductase
MNTQVWWFVARSSGIVAWALLSMSVVWGLLLSTKVSTTRIAARRLRPAWLLGLHRHLGGLAVIFTAIHLIGIVADSYVNFSWAAVLVPMASEWQPGAVAFGVVAMYLLIAIEATSLAIRRLPRNLWRWVHRSSFLLYATATWHGVSAGTDAGNRWFQSAAWLSLALVVGLTVRLVLVHRAKAMPVASIAAPSAPALPSPPRSAAVVAPATLPPPAAPVRTEREFVGVSSGPSDEGVPEPLPTDS